MRRTPIHFFFLLLGLGVFVAGGVLFSIFPLFRARQTLPSTKILARDGSLLYELRQSDAGRRTNVVLSAVPVSLQHAVIATEDKRFYSHAGVDHLALLRVLFGRITGRTDVGGGSTIEMQLVKTIAFPRAPRTVFQKMREMIAADFYALTHSKEATLERYLNEVYFGNGAYGVLAASQVYFQKHVSDLSVGESALLAGMIASPARFDPYSHRAAAKARQAEVLRRMVARGYLSEEARQEAIDSGFALFPPEHPIVAPHFVFFVLDSLAAKFPDLAAGGYVIRTTLDPNLQGVAERSVERRVFDLREKRVTNGAVLAADPRTGEILAMVGSANYDDEEISGRVNMVTALRQPGSSLKPFLYFEALRGGMTPATVIADTPVRYTTAEGEPYYPRNYSYRYFGPVTLREALGSSLNIPAVRVLHDIGLPRFFGTLLEFGIKFPKPADHYGLGIVLGDGEVKLFDLVRAYGILARYGKDVELRAVQSVERDGRVVYAPRRQSDQSLFRDAAQAEKASALLASMLSDGRARARSFGEVNLLDFGKHVAVKTGTTKDFRDNWAVGYSPDFVLGVWVGNANGQPMQGVSGVSGAVPIWYDVMRSVYDRRPAVVWPMPDGIISRDICLPSGKLVTASCLKMRNEFFIAGTEPTELDDWYTTVRVDREMGALATSACMAQSVPRVFLELPSEYDGWFADSGAAAMPKVDCEGRRVETARPNVILSPLNDDQYEIDQHMPLELQRIPFVAGGSGELSYRWILNGVPLQGGGQTYLWTPVPGDYTLELAGVSAAIHFTVRAR